MNRLNSSCTFPFGPTLLDKLIDGEVTRGGEKTSVLYAPASSFPRLCVVPSPQGVTLLSSIQSKIFVNFLSHDNFSDF